MYIQYQQHISTGDIVLDGDIRGLEVVHLNTGSFLLSATGLNGGLVYYAIDANGAVGPARDHVFFQSKFRCRCEWYTGYDHTGQWRVSASGRRA